jgi:hypothetical protein
MSRRCLRRLRFRLQLDEARGSDNRLWLEAVLASSLTASVSRPLKSDAKPPTRPLWNEFYAGTLKGLLNFPNGFCGTSHLGGSLEPPDSRDMYGRNSG